MSRRNREARSRSRSSSYEDYINERYFGEDYYANNFDDEFNDDDFNDFDFDDEYNIIRIGHEDDEDIDFPNFLFKKSISDNPKYDIKFNDVSIYYSITNFDINIKNLDLNNNKKMDFNDLPIINNLDIIRYNNLLEERKKKYIENKHEYYTKKKIFNLILESGAGIFGGSIRDSIIHDYGSILFYDFLKSEDNYLSTSIYDSINILYCNNEFHKESFSDRNTIFNDIDCVMNMNHFNSFISTLDSFNIKYDYFIYNNFRKYIDIIDLENHILKYVILKIDINNPFDVNNIENFRRFNSLGTKFTFKKYNTCTFKLDIIICKDDVLVKDVLDKITSNSDFYCNSLYIYNNSLEINKNIAQNLKNISFISTFKDDNKKNIDIFFKEKIYISEVIEIIKEQIFEKKAISLNLEKKCQFRIDKMKLKGFNIVYSQSIFDEISCKNEICLLCRYEFLDDNPNIKFKCCNSYYHRDCLHDWISKKDIKKCFLCSKLIDYQMLKKFL